MISIAIQDWRKKNPLKPATPAEFTVESKKELAAIKKALKPLSVKLRSLLLRGCETEERWARTYSPASFSTVGSGVSTLSEWDAKQQFRQQILVASIESDTLTGIEKKVGIKFSV
jgi:hypothetical protein